MRKNVLINGKRLIALGLAFCMVFADASIASAASNKNAQPTAVDVAEAPVAAGAEVVTPEKPGKVTNLRFDTTQGDGIIDTSRLSWDAVQGAENYEFRITDDAGREYAYGWTTSYDPVQGKNVPVLTYRSTNSKSYDLDYFINTYSYEAYALNADGTRYEYVYEGEEPNKKMVRVNYGGTYNIYVRAVNTSVNGTVYNDYGYGDWSDPIRYTMPATSKAEALSNVKLHTEENETPYISYNMGQNNYVEAEVKDAQGREYFSWVSVDADGNTIYEYYESYGSLRLYEDAYLYLWEQKEYSDGSKYYSRVKDEKGNYIRPYEVGQTYTIRLRGVNTTGTEPSYSEWTAPITCTIPEIKAPATPEATGNLKYVAGSSNRVSWNEAKDADGYEIELKEGDIWYNNWTRKTAADNSIYYELENPSMSDNYVSTYNTYGSYQLTEDGKKFEPVKDAEGKNVTAFKAGHTYTIRVRAYNTFYNADGELIKQYSGWTAPYTFTIPSGTPEITKVTGVRADYNGLNWDEEANAEDADYTTYYQVEVKDAAGRLYSEDPDDSVVINADGSKTWNVDTQYFTTIGTYADSDDIEDTRIYVADKDSTGQVVGYIPAVYTSGTQIQPYAYGQKYTFRVRAYREYEAGKPIYGAWSDAVTYTVDDAYTGGVQGKPGKVTGLVLNTEEKNNTLTSPKLRWNEIEHASYEIEIKDSKGNLYSYSPDYINNTYYTDYYSCSSTSTTINNLKGLRSYIKKDGVALEVLQNAEGKDAKTFEPGETYTFRVRAVNTYRTWNATKNQWENTEYYYGDWSNAVTYTQAGSTALKDLKYVRADEDYYYFSYKTVINNSTIYYQIATDANFNSASMVRDWTSYSDSTDLLAISKSAFEKGKTYYVRAVNYPNHLKSFDELTDSEIAALAPSIASFTTEAVKTPKNITGLKLYKENSSSFIFRFDAVLKDEDGDYYELQITEDPNSSNWSSYGQTTSLDKDDLNIGTTYVRAVAYVMQKNEVTGNSEKVYGTPSNVVAVTLSEATSSISKLVLKSNTDYSFTFGFSGTVNKSQYVEYQYSDTKTFDTNGEADTHKYSFNGVVNNEFNISYSSLTPGKKYYVRARVRNNEGDSVAEQYGKWTNVVTVSTKIPKIYVGVNSVTKNSVTLTATTVNGDTDGYLTGYEIQRKKGKKWEDVAKTTDATYTVKKLKADNTYTFRVRPYYYNSKDKTFTNGAWTNVQGTTWGAALKLSAKVSGKTSVQLKWSKVPGAKGYEVYRCLGKSSETEVYNGKGNEFTSYKLIKSLGSKSKSFNDKKLTAGMDYTYKVVAYKKIGGKKVTIAEEVSASLDWELRQIDPVQKTNGKVTWTWSPVAGAKGYLVEKQDYVTGKWSKYKTLKGYKKSSITLPKTTDANGVTYRVRAYNGKKYTRAITCKVKPVLAAPTRVKATTNSSTGAITISWKKVSGADYYRVYRTTDSLNVYNKDKKGYSPDGGNIIPMYVEDKSQVSGYRMITETKDMNVTKLVDKRITYTRNGVTNTFYEGPKTGVTYYYYVIAYKNGKPYNYVDDYDGDTYKSFYSKPAKAVLKAVKPGKTSFTSAKASKGKVTLKYKGVTGVDGYEILRSTNSKKGYKVVATVKGAGKLSYVDKKSKKNSLKKGKTYYYKVKTFIYDEAGNKTYSSTSKAKKVKAK